MSPVVGHSEPDPNQPEEDFPTLGADQDDCLLAITEGKALPNDKLRNLPPWRAVMIARVAEKAGVMSATQVERLVAEAREVGGNGRLLHHIEGVGPAPRGGLFGPGGLIERRERREAHDLWEPF